MSDGLLIIERPEYRLGAEELIELGRVPPEGTPRRRPFLMGRARRPILAQAAPARRRVLDLLASAGTFVADELSFALETLADLAGVPAESLAARADVARGATADLLRDAPELGDLAAQILVLGGSLARFGLSVPRTDLAGLGNLLAGTAAAMKAAEGAEERRRRLDAAKARVTARAPEAIREDVAALLSAFGATGEDLAPNVDLDTGAVRVEALTTATAVEDLA